jgi:hypothetical protein
MRTTLRMERLETRDTPAAVMTPLSLFQQQQLGALRQQAALLAQQQQTLVAQLQSLFTQSQQQAFLRPGTFTTTTPNFNFPRPFFGFPQLGLITVGNQPFVFAAPAVVTSVGGRQVVFTPFVLPGITPRPFIFNTFGANPVLTTILAGNNLNATTLAAFNQTMGFPLTR